MNIEIDDRNLKWGDQCLTYSSYYFDNEEYRNVTSRAVLKKILVQWVEVLTKPSNEDRTLFLPLNLDDEWVDCFMVTPQSDKLLFKFVRIDENGWAIDVSDLSSFMTTFHKVLKESSKAFGEYDRDEIITSLLEAKIVDNTGCEAQSF